MIFYSLLAIVLLSPLPFGSNTEWAWNLWSLLITSLAIIWSITFLFKKHSVPFFHHLGSISDVIISYFIVICWILIQATGDFYPSLNHPLWQLQSEITFPSQGFISLTPNDTISSLIRLLSYGLVFWLSLCYSQDADKARRLFYSVIIIGFVYAVYGLITYFGDFKMILWREKKYYLGDLTGTFINHNHFATFAGLILLCTLALIYDATTVSARYNKGGNIGLQRFIENIIIRTWFPLLAFIIIGTALLLTHSRGGFFSSLLGLSVLLIALNSRRKTRNTYLLGIFLVFITVSSIVFYMSSDGLLVRLNSQGLDDGMRALMYQLTWNATLTNPWLGFGLGSFEEVFALYKTMGLAGTLTQPFVIDYAHNTYLEIIFELGIPAAIAWFYCFLRLAILCFIGLITRKKNWIYPAVGLATSCLIAAHATVDFSMQIPAISYLYALLMGAACAQSFSSKSHSH